VEALPIPVGGGVYIPLRSVGTLVQQNSPTSIERIDQQRTVRVNASPDGVDLGTAVAAMRAAAAQYPLPQGVTLFFGGEYEEQQKAFREMLMVFALAVCLVYIVMAAQFESLLHPFIVMFSVPFALVGVVLALILTDTPLTTQAFMGLIMLGGIVVNNAIVLVTYINLLRERGVPLDEAVVRGASTRLRPIAMTTVTTVLGLVPLALKLGEGSEMQSPLAMTVIGGLLVSTLVTLLLIPTLYHWVSRLTGPRPAAQPSRQPGGASVRSADVTAGLFLAALLGLFLALGSAAAAAEVPTPLTLVEAVRIAEAQSPLVVSADLALAEARVAYDEAQANLIGNPSVIQQMQAETAWATAQHNRQLASQDLVMQVAQAYFAVLQADMALELAQRALEQSQAQLESTRLRRSQGMVSDIDVLAAESQVISAELELNRARASGSTARMRLNRLLGIDLETPLVLADDLRPGASTPLELPDLDEAINSALATRLEIQRARAQLELREKELSVAALEPPLVRRRLELAVERARLDLASTETDIILEVRENYQAVVEAQARLAIQEKNLARARESLRITQARHDAGVVTSITLIEAQRTAFQAEMQLIQAEFDSRIALARFYRSAGMPMERIVKGD